MINIDIDEDELAELAGMVATQLNKAIGSVEHIMYVQDLTVENEHKMDVRRNDDPEFLQEFYFYNSAIPSLMTSAIPIIIRGKKYHCSPLHAKWFNEDLPRQLARKERLHQLLSSLIPEYDLDEIIENIPDENVYM